MEVSCQVFGSFCYMSWLPDGRFVIPCPTLRESSAIWAREVSLARGRGPCPSWLRRSLARSREARFTRRNRRACSQAILVHASPLKFLKTSNCTFGIYGFRSDVKDILHLRTKPFWGLF